MSIIAFLWLQALGMHMCNFEENQDGYKFAKLHRNQIQYNNKKGHGKMKGTFIQMLLKTIAIKSK